MKLRRITVAGFKTFASRAEVSFDRGVTAIVGPNGSGKSNLVDALRWALGETNARELRGQRMDEVIYAGGGQRHRVNLAEVTITIDNAEGRLPVDDAEVEVSRRVVRGAGDTEYRINGARARLRDLERLLGGTGLTQNGYAVVAQNDIDGIIEASPWQRRALVEQAAGVRTLRAACDEALQRIEGAEQFLRRIADLLDDAEPRLEELAAQAALALEQRQLAARLSELRGSLAREAWRSARGRLRIAQRRQDQAESRLEAAQEAESAFGRRAADTGERLESARRRLTMAGAELEAARLAAERSLGEARRWDDRLRAAVLQRGAARRELAAARAEVAAVSRALAEQPEDDGTTAARIAELKQRCATLAAAEAEAAEALRATQEQASGAAGALAGATAELFDVEQSLREHTVQLQLFEAGAGSLDPGLAATEQEVRRLQAEVARREAMAAASAREAASSETEATAAQTTVDSAWEAVNSADTALAAAAETARSALARLSAIRGMRRGSLGGEGAIAEAVSTGRLQAERIADLVAVRDAADKVAVAAALEHILGAWLTPELAAAIDFLTPHGPREQLLAAGAPLMSEPVPRPWRAVVDAIDCAPRALGALGAVMRGVWLAPDPASARAALAAGARAAVLPDGRVLSETGARGGDPGSVLELAGDEQAAAAQASTAADNEATAITAAAVAREQLSQAEQELTRRAAAAREQAAVAAAAAAVLAAERWNLEEAERRVAQLLQDREQRLGEERAVASRAAALRERRAAAVLRRDAAAREHAELQSTLDARRDAADRAVRAAREAEVELARSEAAGGGGRQRAEELAKVLENGRSREEQAGLRLLAAESEAVAAIARGIAARQLAVAASEAVTAAQAAVEAAGVPVLTLEQAAHLVEGERAEVAVALARALDERDGAAAAVAEAQGEVARLADVARDEAEDEEDWDPAAAEKAEREIVRLERRVAALGPVNALAPEQHTALQRRVDRLHRDGDDLRQACDDIQAISTRLAEDVERRFDEVFAQVSLRFGEIFAELFPGGRAALKLDEPEPTDPGAGVVERLPGVEILAQPPGKRLGPLRLLSGGERALTALATVLALQQVNPSPFYVFDEVDAALDDSNVLRFTRLLGRLAAQQQFIVVTHNHITMAAADVLWGVTIDSDGVSSVLGVRFDAEVHAEMQTGSALRRIAS